MTATKPQATIGRINRLTVLKQAPQGVLLDAGKLGQILLPQPLVPAGLRAGAEIEVFLFLNAEGQPEATTKPPLAQVGEVAWLKIVSINSIGALLDWGAPKELMLPNNEQLPDIKVGERAMVKIFMDEHHRITASEHLHDFIEDTATCYREGQKVALIVTDSSDLGVTVIVDNAYWGLLYHDEIFVELSIGQRVDGYIKNPRADKKLDVTLNQPGFAKVDGAAGEILGMLDEHEGFMPFTDKSSPEDIYSVFGMSKKVFKQAIGMLFKQRRITIEKNGIKKID